MPDIQFAPLGSVEFDPLTEEELADKPLPEGNLDFGSVDPNIPEQPPVRDFGPWKDNVDFTRSDFSYFDDALRVNNVELADEVVKSGGDILSGMDFLNKAALDQFQAAQNPTVFNEVGGAVETAGKMLINFFGEGFSGFAAFTGAAYAEMGLVEPRFIGAESDGTFVENHISAQGKVAAAHGRFYDYTPLLETTTKDIEGVAQFMDQTLGTFSQYLGNTTLEHTGSPLLATAAQLLPDATLMVLPFMPKAVRLYKQAKVVREFERDLNANFRSKIEEQGLFVETIDEFSGGRNADAGPSAGQTTRVRNAKGEVVGEIQLIDRGGELHITDSALNAELRGQGIGIEMYENAIARAKARGYPSISSDSSVSQSASNVYDGLSRRGYRVEKNKDVTVEETLIVGEQLEDGSFVTSTRPQIISNNSRVPVYRVILDEPAATTTLTPTRMPVETLTALRGPGAVTDIAKTRQLAEDLRAGKVSGEIIVETVEGSPVGILSGAEYLDAMMLATRKAGLNLRHVAVKLQERLANTPEEAAMMAGQAEAGIADIRNNQAKLNRAEDAAGQSIWQKIIHMTADTSGNVKAEILRRMGPLGLDAIRDFTLKAGAVPKAHMMFQDFHRAVFGARAPTDPGLRFAPDIEHLGGTTSEVELFNILVQSRRTQAIVKSGGAKGTMEGFELQGAVKPENAAGNIWAIRQTLGEARFAQLQARADHVFDVMHNQLVRLRDNGIITQGQFMRMQNIDYIRRDFIEAVDPIMLAPGLNKPPISIGESGIYHLQGGSSRAQNIDVQSLVAEYLARTEGRIFRNNANRALREAALEKPDNGLVMIPKSPNSKIPEGMVELKVMIDGKPERMFMKDIYAQEWVVNDPGMNASLANFFRIANGTLVVKPLATGMNPAFALVNFPRDIFHAFKPTGNEFSAFFPRYMGQIFHDMWEVRKDVWNKTGAYREYIEDGGGMNFLTHGGFDPFTGFNRSKDLMRTMGVYRGSFGKWWGDTKESLSKVNEFSELIVRLGIRNRVLKNQAQRGELPNRKQATFIARDYLDFSQGGSVTKAMESWIPYTNAASQAIRTSFRQYTRGSREAGVAALKDLQIVGMKAAQHAWAWAENPEIMAQIDPHTAYTNQIYPTGLSYTDEQGNRRHLTLKIAMDTTTLPFTALLDRAISKHALLATGIDPTDIPSDHLLAQIAGVVPILGSIRTGTPTYQALAALWSNKDIWANRDIWTGDQAVQPGYRRSESTEGTMFDALGRALPEVVSPVQLQKAWRTYVPSNFYFDSADLARKMIQQSRDPVEYQKMIDRDKSDLTLELLAQVPGLSRLIHLTHPAAQTSPEIRMMSQSVATFHEIERQHIDRAVEKYLVLGDSTDFDRILTAVGVLRPNDVQLVQELLITKVAVGTMFRDNEYDIGFVGEDWFDSLVGKDAETRANIYYSKWVELDDTNAQNLNAVIGKIDEVGGRRVWTEEFERHLAQIVGRFGTREERRRGVMGGAN